MQCCDSLYGHLIDLSVLSREKSWLTNNKGLLLPVLLSLISQLIHSIEQLGWDERKVTGMTITRAQLEAGWQLSGKLWCEAQTLRHRHTHRVWGEEQEMRKWVWAGLEQHFHKQTKIICRFSGFEYCKSTHLAINEAACVSQGGQVIHPKIINLAQDWWELSWSH